MLGGRGLLLRDRALVCRPDAVPSLADAVGSPSTSPPSPASSCSSAPARRAAPTPSRCSTRRSAPSRSARRAPHSPSAPSSMPPADHTLAIATNLAYPLGDLAHRRDHGRRPGDVRLAARPLLDAAAGRLSCSSRSRTPRTSSRSPTGPTQAASSTAGWLAACAVVAIAVWQPWQSHVSGSRAWSAFVFPGRLRRDRIVPCSSMPTSARSIGSRSCLRRRVWSAVIARMSLIFQQNLRMIRSQQHRCLHRCPDGAR